MKIYTKTGDAGSTALYGGKRLSKAALRIQAYGDVDELNASIGVAITQIPHEPLKQSLTEIQSTLFVLGGQLADPGGTANQAVRTNDVSRLERQIDAMNETLPPLKTFILPGGSVSAGCLHLSRTICRRAERKVVALAAEEEVDKWPIVYLNRLSDFFFTMARLANQLEGIEDIPWKPQK